VFARTHCIAKKRLARIESQESGRAGASTRPTMIDMDKLKKHSIWTDRRIETILGNVLRAGVIVSACVVSIGAVIYLSRHGTETPDYRVLRGDPADLRSVGGIVRDVFAASGRGIMQFGILLLIATPVMRVLLSLMAFLRQGDKIYVVVTLIVLAILLYSMTGYPPT
jgi:uncharacterized membrane protein